MQNSGLSHPVRMCLVDMLTRFLCAAMLPSSNTFVCSPLRSSGSPGPSPAFPTFIWWSPLHMVAQHQLGGIGIQIGLLQDPRDRVASQMVQEKSHGHYQGHEFFAIVIDARYEFSLLFRVDLVFQEAEDMK